MACALLIHVYPFYCIAGLPDEGSSSRQSFDAGLHSFEPGLFEAIAKVMVACRASEKTREAVSKDHIKMVCQEVPQLRHHLVKYFNSPESCLLDACSDVLETALAHDSVEVRRYPHNVSQHIMH